MSALIRCDNLNKTYTRNIGKALQLFPAVKNVSLKINKGEILGLVGESGSGKTTLGKLLVKLIEPTKGSIYFDGHEVTFMGIREYRPFRKKIQSIFQNPYAALNPGMTVRQLIEEAVKLYGLNGVPIQERVDTLMAHANLNPAKLEQYPRHLSGGERRRVGIARILALNPSVIVLDEPVAALDVSIKAQIIDLLISRQKQDNLTFLWISHDLVTIRQVAGRIAIMFAGSIVEILKNVDPIELFHPYSIELFNSAKFMSASDRGFDEDFLEFDTFQSNTVGCTYRNRCRLFKESQDPDICCEQVPELKKIKGQHYVACHLK